MPSTMSPRRRHTHLLTAYAAGLAFTAGSLLAVATPAATAAAPTTLTFAHTGAAQTWVVPAGVTSATFDLHGAAGNTGLSAGGKGGRATATLSVTPGETVTVLVGGAGLVNAGGFNGGGKSSRSGGGASDVRIGGTDLDDRVLVAGGGGGAGGCGSTSHPENSNGGAGGGAVGTDGAVSSFCFNTDGARVGTGGTQTSEGTNARSDLNNGSFGAGGSNFVVHGAATGGGGGGWYGGAAGARGAGGGGGSGHGPAGTVFETGVRDGHGVVTITFTAPDPQTISLGPTPTGKSVASPAFQVTATASSGLPVTYSTGGATTNNACTVSSTGLVTIAHAGTCQVAADQAGNADFLPAHATQSFPVSKLAQAIAFTSIPPSYVDIGDTFPVAATGGASGNPVTFSTASAGICIVTGATVKFTGPGQCVVRANQAGNADYTAAPQVTQTIKVRKTQEISFITKPTLLSTTGGTYQVGAASDSGLSVILAIDPATTNGACTISGTTVTLRQRGTCVIAATQPGNTDWAPAPKVTQTFAVTRNY